MRNKSDLATTTASDPSPSLSDKLTRILGSVVKRMSLTIQELQDQLVTLRVDARDRSPGELSRVENVAEEFFQLQAPRSSEILDVAAGSGIVSALIQTGGNN